MKLWTFFPSWVYDLFFSTSAAVLDNWKRQKKTFKIFLRFITSRRGPKFWNFLAYTINGVSQTDVNDYVVQIIPSLTSRESEAAA